MKLQQLTKSPQITFPAKIFKLANGLTVIHQYLAATPVVVTDVWVKAGAIAEPEEWSGMAHFLEHMIFKGTKNILPGEFDLVVESTGGMSNAATSHDYAHFFLTTAAQYLPQTLPLLAEILLQAAIDDEEFYRERDVVLEEIHSCYDDPDWIGFQVLCETLYERHPYRRCILGEEELLLQYTPNQMRCFHSTHYQPKNMTVVIVGGIEEETALSLVKESFSNFKILSECPKAIIEAEPPLIEIRKSEIYLPRLEQARLLIAWSGPGIENLQDAVGLDLLSVILAGGLTSRLVSYLQQEKQWVYHIGSEFSLQKESSLFTISALLEEKYLDIVERVIQKEIYKLQHKPVREAELNRCKRLLLSDYIFSTETPAQLAGLYGYYATIASAEMSITYPSRIAEFEASELQRLASQYLSGDRYAVTILKGC